MGNVATFSIKISGLRGYLTTKESDFVSLCLSAVLLLECTSNVTHWVAALPALGFSFALTCDCFCMCNCVQMSICNCMRSCVSVSLCLRVSLHGNCAWLGRVVLCMPGNSYSGFHIPAPTASGKRVIFSSPDSHTFSSAVMDTTPTIRDNIQHHRHHPHHNNVTLTIMDTTSTTRNVTISKHHLRHLNVLDTTFTILDTTFTIIDTTSTTRETNPAS